MRTKSLVLAAAALVGGLLTAQADNVYSLNIVGYVNLEVPAGQYALLANQLVQTNTQVDSLLANVPANTQVVKWNGTAFAPNNLDPDFGWDDPTMTLDPGEGFFVKNNASTNITLTFVGEVPTGTNVFSFTAGQYSLIGLKQPLTGLIQTDLGFPASANDTVIKWNGTTYAPSLNDPDFGWDVEPYLNVGDGFFVLSPDTKDWTRVFNP